MGTPQILERREKRRANPGCLELRKDVLSDDGQVVYLEDAYERRILGQTGQSGCSGNAFRRLNNAISEVAFNGTDPLHALTARPCKS